MKSDYSIEDMLLGFGTSFQEVEKVIRSHTAGTGLRPVEVEIPIGLMIDGVLVSLVSNVEFKGILSSGDGYYMEHPRIKK